MYNKSRNKKVLSFEKKEVFYHRLFVEEFNRDEAMKQ